MTADKAGNLWFYGQPLLAIRLFSQFAECQEDMPTRLRVLPQRLATWFARSFNLASAFVLICAVDVQCWHVRSWLVRAICVDRWHHSGKLCCCFRETACFPLWVLRFAFAQPNFKGSYSPSVQPPSGWAAVAVDFNNDIVLFTSGEPGISTCC